MKILIKEEFQDDFTTRIAGERLRKKILSVQEKIILDFEGLKIASASFFDEGIAKLSEEGWNSDDVENKVHFLNLFKKDQELLRIVCKDRGIILK